MPSAAGRLSSWLMVAVAIVCVSAMLTTAEQQQQQHGADNNAANDDDVQIETDRFYDEDYKVPPKRDGNMKIKPVRPDGWVDDGVEELKFYDYDMVVEWVDSLGIPGVEGAKFKEAHMIGGSLDLLLGDKATVKKNLAMTGSADELLGKLGLSDPDILRRFQQEIEMKTIQVRNKKMQVRKERERKERENEKRAKRRAAAMKKYGELTLDDVKKMNAFKLAQLVKDLTGEAVVGTSEKTELRRLALEVFEAEILLTLAKEQDGRGMGAGGESPEVQDEL